MEFILTSSNVDQVDASFGVKLNKAFSESSIRSCNKSCWHERYLLIILADVIIQETARQENIIVRQKTDQFVPKRK